MKKFISILLIITMLVLGVLLNFAGCADKDKGVKSGSKIVASSDNFEISYSMMEYFANSYYQNWYSNNYYYILLGYVNFNPNDPLDEQYIDSSKTFTYYDYFVDGTKTTVETYLKYCEAAKADATVDFTQLENDANAYAEESIAQLREAAEEYSDASYQDGGTKVSFTDYIKTNFGESVTVDALKQALVIEHIASSYYEIVHQRTNEEDLNAWFEALPSYNVQFEDDVFRNIFNNSFQPQFTGNNDLVVGDDFVVVLPVNPDNSGHNH